MKRAGPPAHEPFETHVLSQIIKPGDTVLDLGAHIGHYTRLFSELVGEKGAVYAFEPDPENFKALTENVERRHLANVILDNHAVANKTGNLRLYTTKANSGDYRIFDSGDGRVSIPIDAIRLDYYFRGPYRKIDFIKMDIQGSEPGAIDGAKRILRDNKGLQLVTEFWPFGLRLFGIEPEDYLRTLLEYGFTLENIVEKTKTLEPISDINRLLSRYDGNMNVYTNLLATR